MISYRLVQIDTRIKVFIEHKNEQVNTTNNQEFLKVPEPQPGKISWCLSYISF